MKIQEDKNMPQDIADIIIPITLEFVFVLNANGIIQDAINNTHAIVIVSACAVITVCFYFLINSLVHLLIVVVETLYFLAQWDIVAFLSSSFNSSKSGLFLLIFVYF